jgi:hypothetical protein
MKKKLLPKIAAGATVWLCLAGSYPAHAQTASAPLAGCSEPAVIVSALQKLRDSDWKQVTPDRILEIWPNPIRPLDCESGQICRSWIREGRIIGGDIECADVFEFEKQVPNSATPTKQLLHRITIHYTAKDHSEIAALEKSFADAIGGPVQDVKSLGRSDTDAFQWEGKGFEAGLNLQLTPVKAKWNLFFSYSRWDPKEPEEQQVQHATGTFDVKLAPQMSEPPLGRMSIEKQFHGGLEGTSKGEMLSAGTGAKGSSGGYVAMEQFSGTLDGRKGTFVLQHSGTMTAGTPQLKITVVPDSGTGELVGLGGTFNLTIADGKHSYDFEYSLPEAH